jgi:hypothetical protein
VIVATIGDAVSVVATVKICDDSPAGIVVRAGTMAAALLLVSVTARPPAGAERVTVPITCDPATIDADDSDSFCSVRRPTVSLAVLVASVYVAVITATPVTEVAAVWTSNVPEVDPEAIVMDAGTVASEVSLLDSVTTAPSEGAAAVNAIVPVTVFPPATAVEDSEMLESAAAVDEGEDGDLPHAA